MHPSEIDQLVNKGISELEMSDTFLIDVKIKNNKIEIFLDSDAGMDYTKCQKLSRWIEAILDETKVFGEQYVLDISSPGVGSPLKFLRQYVKNVGRIIDVKYGEGKSVRGNLQKVEDSVIYVEYEAKVKEGKKNKKVKLTEAIKFEDIIESKIKISFN
ncbi:MAG: ribosome maturation factor [Saprospiraceae bacterium]